MRKTALFPTIGFLCALLSLADLASIPQAEAAPWVSPNHYRAMLSVNPRGVARRNSPASVDIDMPQVLTSMGAAGTFDEHTIEVVAYDTSGAPKVYDATRPGYEKYLLPWRIEKYYGVDYVTLNFVMPDDTYTDYAVYFDTEESGLGQPQRYPGLVGDGDRLVESYGRREINASGYDTFCDFDSDGDLDILKGACEPYIYYYENVGGNRFEDRGKLTSNGTVFVTPMDGDNRSWNTLEMCDWDLDGDYDMFLWSPTGWPGGYAGEMIRYENTTVPPGPLTFEFRGVLRTVFNEQLGPLMTFVDWDDDGKRDLLVGRDGLIEFHRNVGPVNSVSNMQFDTGSYVMANGVPLNIWNAHVECADIDSDGDLDLFVGTENGQIYWFTNVGTRSNPVFTEGRIIAWYEFMDSRSGATVADFDGDSLLDFVAGRHWERTQWGEQDRLYGRLYKNVGTPTSPRFEARDAYGGSPYMEGFPICDVLHQSGVRGVDWNNDGRTDLIGSDTDGFVWYFRNTTDNPAFAEFEPGVKITSAGKPIRVYGEEREKRAAGYARVDVCDWNDDGRKDLLVADGRGWLFAFLNEGTDENPVLGEGERVYANGKPIDGTPRSSVLVCDWNNDGNKDVIFGMVGRIDPSPMDSEYFDWPHLHANPGEDLGFLFYENVGTDGEGKPILAFPKWIESGTPSSPIEYTRPNLGSYVDWDNDGLKDFIGCEFEHSVRFYKNMGNHPVTGEPQFTSSTSGVHIVQPFTVQMISGADAIDWNGDGDPSRVDIDILTGQGHGASGLRLYERDYIEDFVNDTFPIVTTAGSARGYPLWQAKTLPDGGQPLTIAQVVVSAAFDDFFYVQSTTRVSGIRVELPGHAVTEGQTVDVTGTLATNAAGERYIAATSVVVH